MKTEQSIDKREFTTTDVVSLEELPNKFDVVAYYSCSRPYQEDGCKNIGLCYVLTGKGRNPIYKTMSIDSNLCRSGIVAIVSILSNLKPDQSVAIVGVDEYALKLCSGNFVKAHKNLDLLPVVQEKSELQKSVTFIHVRANTTRHPYQNFASTKAREVAILR